MLTEEYETILIFNKEKKIWEAGTNIPTHQNLLERKGWKLVKETPDGEKGYEAPKNAITFRNLNANHRTLTPEQKAQAAERLANARQLQKNAS